MKESWKFQVFIDLLEKTSLKVNQLVKAYVNNLTTYQLPMEWATYTIGSYQMPYMDSEVKMKYAANVLT